MAFLRTTVTGSIALPDGSLMPDGAKIIFTLRGWDKNEDTVAAPGPIEATVQNGTISVPLLRTASNARQTTYDVGYAYWNPDARKTVTGQLGAIAISGSASRNIADLLALPAPVPNVPDALAQALAAAADGITAANSANAAAMMALVGTGRGFDTVQQMLSSTITYGLNSITHNGQTVSLTVAAGNRWGAGGFSYEVAAPGAANHHLTTDGGVKLRVLPVVGGTPPEAFGALRGGADDTVALRGWLSLGGDLVCEPNAVYRYTRYLSPVSGTFIRGNGAMLLADSWGLDAGQDTDWKKRANFLLWGIAGFHAHDIHFFCDVDARPLETIGIGRVGVTVYAANDIHFLRCSSKVSDAVTTNFFIPIDLHGGNIDGFSWKEGWIYDNVRQGMWFRSLGGTSTVTRNVWFTDNEVVVKNSQDEALAIFGVQGGIENVWVERNRFIDLGEGEMATVFVSTFGTGQPSAYPNSYVRNVWWRDNTIILRGGATTAVVSIGRPDNTPAQCQDVHFVSNTLHVANMAPGAFILRHGAGLRNHCDGNTVLSLDSAACLGAVTGDWDTCAGNTLDVFADFAIYATSCPLPGNTIIQRNPAGYAFRHSVRGAVSGGKITTPRLFFLSLSDGIAQISDNEITITGDRIAYLNVGAGRTGGLRLFNNRITMTAAATLFEMLNAATGTSEIVGNRFSGIVPADYAIGQNMPFKRVEGNDWFGVSDRFASANPHQSASWTRMFPRGCVVANEAAAPAEGAAIMGWMKAGTGTTSAAWLALTVAA
ncbi:hypothetical protein [Paracoccus tibetensis]|uniref:Uncharacterized protein n=1 Tax=Paracoccus tibetensis TaxID=336292 RepID=A0A1G5BDF2_9RHOB|nr:hypothetical protein [Paracoccus tibetensis]SCX88161.1 hypothetical protein SAMN05660710_00099 [Paracoccus tibetensis]